VKKLLLLRPGAMGDVCMTVPLVRALQEHYEVHWLVWRHHQAIPRCFPQVRCRVIPAQLTPASPDQPPFPPSLVAALEAERYDALLDLCHWPETARLARHLTGIPLRAVTHDPAQDRLLGIQTKGIDLQAPFNCRVPVGTGLHQLDKWRQLVRHSLGLELQQHWPLPPRRPRTNGSLRVFVHPHASKPAKVWPLHRFVGVLTQLSRERRVICDINSGSKHELARALRLWLLLAARGIAARVVPLDRGLGRLQSALRHADFALGCDSGPLHFAALLGVPSVVVYGSYPAGEFGPLWRSVPVSAPCAGAPALDVSIEQVHRAVAECLAADWRCAERSAVRAIAA